MGTSPQSMLHLLNTHSYSSWYNKGCWFNEVTLLAKDIQRHGTVITKEEVRKKPVRNLNEQDYLLVKAALYR